MKQKNKLALTAFLLSACWMLSTGAVAAEAKTGRVATQSSPLTVRASTSTASQRLSSLARGSEVALLYRTGDWWYVEYAAGRYGYCHADYIAVVAQDSATQINSPISLGVPDYKQYDARWANHKVGASGRTLKQIGCVTAALADTESYRTGTAITPAQMEARLSYTEGGAAYWPEHYQKDAPADYLAVILRNLQAGKPTIVGSKNASGKAHWVVVTGYSGSGSLRAADFAINDPGSGSRSVLSELFADYPYFYKLEYYS